MTTYFVLKYLHVIGASVLLGTGAGIAFFMLLAAGFDDELGGRLVVLKIGPDRGPEPSILGRLEHTSIVPALSVTREPSTGRGRGHWSPLRGSPPRDVLSACQVATAMSLA